MVLLACSACTIQPKVELVSEQTALEKQLLGRFAELDEKALLIAPMRHGAHAGKVATDYKRAVAGRAFRFDELDGWIKKGWLLEDESGVIRQRRGANVTLVGKMKKRFERLIKQENGDRAMIIDHVIHYSADFHDSDKSSLAQLFHQLRLKELPTGAWVHADGRDFQKKE
ncbi:hypothetical protein D8Y20_11545 [Mariprofundus sp. EBB-1]|nr:hypothetical protein D8Y20_11545 [Mariprofundus sp. EBB-1]